MKLTRVLLTVTLCSGLATRLLVGGEAKAQSDQSPGVQSSDQVNPVVQWNKNLLVIVRTAGAQPATVHSTRSFAIMHAAIYDAVNAIDRSHKPYLVRLAHRERDASQEAAADAAAHEILVALYPSFKTTLDTELQQLLAQVPDGEEKADGIGIGQTVADRILALRSTDGATSSPVPYVFGNAPGDYQSTPPNFPPQPQFTHWSHVTPFALERADQFRPGPPPALTSDKYSDAFNQVKLLGVLNSTNRNGRRNVDWSILERRNPKLLERDYADGIRGASLVDGAKRSAVRVVEH